MYNRLYLLYAGLIPFERCIEQTIEYTRDRKAFGRSILDNQVVHFRLAEMESEVEALRSLVYRTVGEYWVDTPVNLITRPIPSITLKSSIEKLGMGMEMKWHWRLSIHV